MASLKYKGQSLGGGGGQDATVNGVNDLTVVAGENITLGQDDKTLYISAYGGWPVLAVTIVPAAAGVTVTAKHGGTTLSGVTDSEGYVEINLPELGTWEVSATIGGGLTSERVLVDGNWTFPVSLYDKTGVYGVQWDGTASTLWTRTDDAALFPDPVPYTTGMLTAECSSPFDNIMPWAGMVVSERVAGRMVSIPKFYYSLTQEGAGLSIKISMTQQDGFSCSPAHMDRGDGKGERDVVYIGRYHCSETDYKSTTGVKPKVNITRSTARTAIHALGDTIWQNDFAMRFTIWLLYLVEFANWNSQAVIGYGCGNGSCVQNMGASDSMPYHTGTMQSARTTYGVGVQYRNIEGLWENVWDWCDGCNNNDSGFCIIIDPASFSASVGISAGIPAHGYSSAFSVSYDCGYPVFIPTFAGGTASTYMCDSWQYNTTSIIPSCGGHFSEREDCGLFFVGRNKNSGIPSTGTRLMELPDPT